MSASPFMAFAQRHDLDYAERIAPDAAGRFPLPHGEASELVGGALPGGYEGLVARLRRRIDAAETDAEREFVLVVTRIRESVGFARFISCFQAGFRGPISRAIGAGGLGWIREYSFESIEFNRRYRVAMLRTGKENRLRQLFSPVFLDWMAETAPEGLYFDLLSGVLTVTFAGEPSEPGDVDRVCELAGRIAERIRSEALEGTLGDDRDPEADAAWEAGEAHYAELIRRAGLDSPPTHVGAALERLGPVIGRKKGFLRRLLGSKQSVEATMLSMIAVLRAYGDRAGLEQRHPDALHQLLPFLDHFPMTVLRQLSLRGTLPSSGASGELVAFADLTSMGSRDRLSCRPAAELQTGPDDRGLVYVLPMRDEGSPRSMIGGFGVALGDGDQRVTEPTRREREAAAALAESLGGRLEVLAHGWPGPAPIGGAARAWLASGAGDALVDEAGKLTLVGAARPATEWSFETIDAFCESVAPVVAEVGDGAARS